MTRQAGINLENVKIRNKSTVLKLLNRKGAMSRKDIAKEVGLTPATVTVLCTEMIEEGILQEKGEMQEERRAGRRKILVDIAYGCKCVVAVSIESKKTYISACDLKGNLISGKIIKTDTSIAPIEFLKVIEKECKVLLWENEIEQRSVLGMGICIPGIVDRNRGISIRAYGIWKEEVRIKEIMQETMSCPVIVENNIKAFAEGELLYGAGRTGDNLLFVKWGPGVGSAIVTQNQIYEGKDHRAAEIGHYIIEPNGELCHCGRRGCLETKVSTEAIIKRIRSIYSKEHTPRLYENTGGDIELISESNFTEWAESGNELDMSDEEVVKILHKSIERLARTIVNMMTILAPDSTILFGFMLENEEIRKIFMEYCQQYDSTYTEEYIQKSELSRKIYYIGATAIATRQYFFEPKDS